MGNFIVSARKYRPETFSSVVGQGSITTTLKNAIRNDHVGHAYLFCGPRGVGKTTCARIFAKTINCSDPADKSEPCNKCESCLSFNESRSYNIHELDAASNNSVEDIRSLTDQVRIPPQLGKYSVYIIDEVHMLSQSAFNAFLKTLEEPPSHAIFILATTEKHKIIPTILSRCQVFDFNRIRVEDAVRYLEFICREEKISYEAEALHVIAQKADGAMRDALSIFDQAVSFSEGNLKYLEIIEHLNILDYDYYFKMVDYLLVGETSKCLLCLDEIMNHGFDALNFINGLAAHIRDLLVSKNPETIKLLEVSENHRNRYVEQSRKCDTDFLFSCLDIANNADIHYKNSHNQRLLTELSLLKMVNEAGVKKKSLTGNKSEEPVKADTLPPVPEARGEVAEKVTKQAVKESLADKVRVDNIHVRKNAVAGKNISIRSAVEGNMSDEKTELLADEENNDNPEEFLENDFTQEDLETRWKAYADLIQAERPRIAGAMKNNLPAKESGYRIILSLENENITEDFNTYIRSDLTDFLRKELMNNSINLVVMAENNTGNGKKIIYTPEEKFLYLVKKNPLLDKFKQQFNLELE